MDMSITKGSPTLDMSIEEAKQEEDSISNKVRELELSLPRKKWLASPYIYLYQNFWVPSHFLNGVICSQENFLARDSDIFIISKPKSGTTWLQALTFAILNRGIYPITENQSPNSKPHPLSSHNPQQLAPLLEIVMNQTLKRHLSINLVESHHPRLLATHLPYNALPDSIKTFGCRIVYISRNILDTVISFWFFSHHFRAEERCGPKEEGDLSSLEDYVDSVYSGVEDFGPHWDHVLGYWQESLKRPNKVLFMKYEDLKGDQISEMKRLAEFMGCSFTTSEEESGVIEQIARLCSIRSLKEMGVNKSNNGDGKASNLPKFNALFRKGEVGDWMNHMTPSMAEHLEKVMKEKFHGSGLTFKTIKSTTTTSSS